MFARRDDKNIVDFADKFHREQFRTKLVASRGCRARCRKLIGEIVSTKGATCHCVPKCVLSVSLLLPAPGGQTTLTYLRRPISV